MSIADPTRQQQARTTDPQTAPDAGPAPDHLQTAAPAVAHGPEPGEAGAPHLAWMHQALCTLPPHFSPGTSALLDWVTLIQDDVDQLTTHLSQFKRAVEEVLP